MPRWMRTTLAAVLRGLQLALLAPPVAALVFALVMAVVPDGRVALQSPGSAVLLLIGLASGAYLLGGLPAFIAGLALHRLERLGSPFLAAAATGAVGVGAYLLTFGSHQLQGPLHLASVAGWLAPALLGVALPAYGLARWAPADEPRHLGQPPIPDPPNHSPPAQEGHPP